jgi:2-desacetyl-2-hydroxyethyl bacteriochlorophyllide A dehydrogenase
MRCIILEKPQELKVIDKDHPGKPSAGKVLLKVKRLGICGTDLHAFNGKQPFFTYPRILGHEIAAEVIELGEAVTHLTVGDQCTVMPYRNTVIDQAVRRGKTNCGSGLSVLGVHEDGAMQEFIICHADLVFEANGLPLDLISIIEPIAIGSHATERADVRHEDIVLIIGAGPIGIATLAMALLKSPRMIVLDTNQQRLDFVSKKYPGVITMLADENVVNHLTVTLNGDLPTIVIDATGNRESMLRCFDYVAPGGSIVYVGLFVGDIVFQDPYFHRKEITLMSSRNAVADDFRKIIRLLRTGVLNMDGYITHRLDFNRLENTFTSLYKPGVIKAVVYFDK